MRLQVPPTIESSDCRHSEFHSWTAFSVGGPVPSGVSRFEPAVDPRRRWPSTRGRRGVLPRDIAGRPSGELRQLVESERIE